MRTFARHPRLLLVSVILLWGVTPPLWAETWYVADECTSTLRRGEDITYKIIKSLSTGTRLELLQDGAKGWSLVRTETGLEGWMLKNTLSTQPPARLRVAEAEEAREKAEKERDALRQELGQVKGRLRVQEKLEAELAHVKSVSENALNLEESNKRLTEQARALEVQSKELTEEKQLLEKQSVTQSFLAGAGVLALGFISGGILANRRRRGSYGSLS
ncbi:MAG: TIGR04211 family SH3 domain-containing protein [Magnetococcales bacterium]|nr:TIGR04211 family SH3 domain-containing protein [Magnetococcales bacterium]